MSADRDAITAYRVVGPDLQSLRGRHRLGIYAYRALGLPRVDG